MSNENPTTVSVQKEPWYNDRDVILKLILLGTLVTNLIQSIVNGSRGEQVKQEVQTVQAVQQQNRKKIDNIHTQVQEHSVKMGMKPPPVEE